MNRKGNERKRKGKDTSSAREELGQGADLVVEGNERESVNRVELREEVLDCCLDERLWRKGKSDEKKRKGRGKEKGTENRLGREKKRKWKNEGEGEGR